MKLSNLKNKSIALFGFGIENYAMLKYLQSKNISANFVVCDRRDADTLNDRIAEFKGNKNIAWVLNGLYDKNLPAIDIVFRSPGWPLFDINIKSARKAGAQITSAMQLFCDLSPARNLIGVTGTKGKGTTSSLLAAILKDAGKQVYLGGNIGVAPFSFLPNLKRDDYVVLELSSFQLEDLCVPFKIGIFTNLSREHLSPADPNNPNHHKTMSDYFSAKLNIFCNQNQNGHALVNSKLENKIKSLPKDSLGHGRISYFNSSNLPTPLIGEHNRENIAAAEEAAKILKVNKKSVARAVAAFSGLEHRIEFVAERAGVRYYNDSFATMPDATITALKSFTAPIILLAGGADKGNNFKELAHEIKKRVKFLVLFEGRALPRLKSALKKAGFNDSQLAIADSMPSAIKLAQGQAHPGDIILLSPACASFGIFKNYKERGRLFKENIDI